MSQPLHRCPKCGTYVDDKVFRESKVGSVCPGCKEVPFTQIVFLNPRDLNLLVFPDGAGFDMDTDRGVFMAVRRYIMTDPKAPVVLQQSIERLNPSTKIGFGYN